MRQAFILALSCILLLAAPGTPAQEGNEAGEGSSKAASQLTLDDLRTFTDVFNQVRRNYVEEVDDRMLLESAINGMLSELDPHSAYLPNSDYEDLENTSRGEYVGIGTDVAAEDGRVVVKGVIVPSPADSAGINPGDIILAINSVPVKGNPLQESIDRMSGPPDSILELKIVRPGQKPKTLTLKREFVKVPALNFELLDGSIGHFHLAFFHRDSAEDLKASLDSISDDGIELDGLILDLRENGGGVLQPAIEIADGFLDSGDIVSMKGREASMQTTFSATPGQWLPGIPLVILVDRGSASASEVLAGALQDNGRAVIVGERTFGKGSVQSVLPLRNGAGIKLTTARYYTPSGKSIQAQGIEPDIVVASAVDVLVLEDDRILESDLDRHLLNPADEPLEEDIEVVDAELDYPLYEALNLLRANRIFYRDEQLNGD